MTARDPLTMNPQPLITSFVNTYIYSLTSPTPTSKLQVHIGKAEGPADHAHSHTYQVTIKLIAVSMEWVFNWTVASVHSAYSIALKGPMINPYLLINHNTIC